MLWVFERRNEYLRIESSGQRTGVFKARFADGTEPFAQFTSENECQQKPKVVVRLAL
jgi:hypothetical protein